MKIVALTFICVSAASQAHAAYGVDAQKAALACTGQTFKEAAAGDFSHWVLPQWLGVKSLRAGQWVDENCQVKP